MSAIVIDNRGNPTSGGGGAVDSVNGMTGAVVLTKTNVGLSNVDNTSDANKPVSTAQQTALDLKTDNTVFNAHTHPIDTPRNPVHVFDDFIGLTQLVTLTATGGSVSAVGNTGTLNQIGHVRIRVATLNALAGLTSTVNCFRFGSAVWTAKAVVKVVHNSDGTDNYVFRFGFGDTTGAADITDGAYFEYDSTASVNWRLCTATAGVRTKVDSGVVVNFNATFSTDWKELKVIVNEAATQADYYINTALVGSITTNIPTGNNFTGYQIYSVKTLGSGVRDVYCDYVDFYPTWATGITRYN